ncbi:MAG: hypothetical protein AAB974_01235 [Patescibacteria group bacterium]
MFCIAAMAVSNPVQAQEDVAVLGITSVESDEAAAQVITRQLRIAVSRVRGWHMLPGNISLAQMVLGAACPGEYESVGCLPAIAELNHARHVVSGVLTRNPDTAHGHTLDLFWYDTGTASIIGRCHVGETGEGDALIAEKMRDWLTRMGIPSADPVSDGNALLIPAISLIGAAAASFAVTVGSWVRLSDIEHDPAYQSYRERVPPGTSNVCTEADAGNVWTFDEATVRKLCSEAATFEILQWVFLVASAASAGLGTAFLLFDPGTERPPVTVTPSVSANRATFTVTARF